MASQRSSLCHHCTDSIRVVETGWDVTWQHSECMRRVLQVWSLWLVSCAKYWYFSALIATSSILRTRLLDTFIVVLVQFLVRFSIHLTSLEFMTKDWRNLNGFQMVVRGSQHRRKSHRAANYVSGSDSSRNGKVDWYLLEYDTSAENMQTCSTEENTKFHEVWPCILSSSSYHCCWTPRHGPQLLGIDTRSHCWILWWETNEPCRPIYCKIDIFWTSPDNPLNALLSFLAMLPCR